MMDDEFYSAAESAAEPPEVQEPVAAAPALDEDAIRQRYVQPLEQEIHQLKETLNPQRIEAWQKQQDWNQARISAAAGFHKSLDDGDPIAALRHLLPQLGWWDQAHQAQARFAYEQQQRWQEQEKLREITAEVEGEEAYFYATDPEGHALLREFVPICARQYAEMRGQGSKVTREDTRAARDWMEHIFTEHDFQTAASQMAAHVRASKQTKVPQRQFPTAPAPGARPSRRPVETHDDGFNLDEYYS